jgi:hypothetical protein
MKLHKVIILLVSVTVLLFGCASMQQSSYVEIDQALFTCTDYPELVDGDLNTISAIETSNTFGNPAAIIRFIQPIYVAYIEVYAESKLSNIHISMANIKEIEGQVIPFEQVITSGTSPDIDKGEMKVIRIGKVVTHIRLMVNWLRDRERGVVLNVVPVKSPEIREVKFYTTSGGSITPLPARQPLF